MSTRAKDIGDQMKPELRSEHLVELPDYHVACRLLNRNTPTRPFVLKTIDDRNSAPSATTGVTSTAIRALSNSRYARPVNEVEAEILCRREAWKTNRPIQSTK